MIYEVLVVDWVVQGGKKGDNSDGRVVDFWDKNLIFFGNFSGQDFRLDYNFWMFWSSYVILKSLYMTLLMDEDVNIQKIRKTLKLFFGFFVELLLIYVYYHPLLPN